MEYLDHALERDLHKTLHKATTWARKKGKHLKDTNLYFYRNRRQHRACPCCYTKEEKVKCWQHKHTRAKRVYLEEEYTPYSEEYKVNSSYIYDAEMDGPDQYEEDLLFEGYEQYLGTRGDVLFDKIQDDKVNPKCIWCGESNYCECY